MEARPSVGVQMGVRSRAPRLIYGLFQLVRPREWITPSPPGSPVKLLSTLDDFKPLACWPPQGSPRQDLEPLPPPAPDGREHHGRPRRGHGPVVQAAASRRRSRTTGERHSSVVVAVAAPPPSPGRCRNRSACSARPGYVPCSTRGPPHGHLPSGRPSLPPESRRCPLVDPAAAPRGRSRTPRPPRCAQGRQHATPPCPERPGFIGDHNLLGACTGRT
jgi:hypothetical protein